MIRFVLIACALALTACPTNGPVPFPIVDASDAAPLPVSQSACAHLRDLGCPLGSDPNCAAAFSLPAKFRANPACVLDAGRLADLAPCNVTCQP